MLGTDIAEIWILFAVLFFGWTLACALSVDGEKPWAIGTALGLLLAVSATIGLVTGRLGIW